ncbi:hypothetical protein ACFQ1E_06045 [Sphingomonas canadensis]|uniref:Uncharacterized protein n=1 Tax=Sphingomonas canadensis TaxID=1219257 RepID=A0ABW3H9B1_9SPHN|nr:hypothetical protein [Sphingomonas canadensis]MCW3835649.1 hypothetical protein [Sphingomonas canadensis]
MADRAALMRELDLLEKVQADLAAIAGRADDDRRHDLIRLRKALSDQISAVGREADQFFSGLGDADFVRDFRNRFSQMRSAAALHQARWPAVRLGEYVEEYRESARVVRETNRAFIAWARSALSALVLDRR